MAPMKRELNGGMFHGNNPAAKAGRKNNKTPAANTTEHSTASTSRKKEGIGGLSSDRSNISSCFFHRHLISSTSKETKINANDRFKTMQPDIMSIKRHDSKSGPERRNQSHQSQNCK